MKILVTSIVLMIAFAGNITAAENSGVRFEEYYKDQGVAMSLQGIGLKRMLFFKAFVAGFYAKEGNETNILGNYPKRIEVEYFVNIPGNKLNDFTLDTMKNNVTPVELTLLKNEINKMKDFFVDLKAGDRFSLTYIPNIGTKFAHNGQLVGIIQGQEFARALFSVWIGEKPFDAHLKEQVLGLKQSV